MILRIVSFVLFALTIAAAYGGYANPKYSALPGIAVMALPYLAIASGIVTVLWIVSGRWITGAIGVLALVAAWGPISSAVPLKLSKNPRAGSQTFSLMSWNFLHGCDQNAQETSQEGNESLEYIINSGADIVCLQELQNYTADEVPNLDEGFRERMDKTYPYSAHRQGNDQWVFSKYPVTNISGDEMQRRIGAKAEGPVVSRMSFYIVDINGHDILLVNVHLHSPGLNDAQKDIFKDINSRENIARGSTEFEGTTKNKIQGSLIQHNEDVSALVSVLENYNGPVVVCGDFNDVPASYSLRKMEKAGFKEVNAEVGFGPLISYNRYMMWFQMDHILYRGDLKALKIKKGRIRTSDHYPQTATFEI